MYHDAAHSNMGEEEREEVGQGAGVGGEGYR